MYSAYDEYFTINYVYIMFLRMYFLHICKHMELWIEPWAVTAFFVLLVASIWMLVNFYICDSNNCKAFNDAGESAPVGSKEYVEELLYGEFNDGIWPIPYIGASILTPLSLWFIGTPITVRNFAILFFVSFVTIYFMFGFFGHHYIKPITKYVSDWIQDSCPNSSDNQDLNSVSNENILPDDQNITQAEQNISSDNNTQ